jgi:cholesterol transport system auxiliary component
MKQTMTLFNSFFIKLVFVIASTFILTSCLSPIKSQPDYTYVINVVPEHIPKRHKRPITLLVLQPTAEPAYDTTKMAYSTYPYQIAYFGQNRWIETPAQMLQPLLVKTLQQTHRFHAVVSLPYVGQYDYVLTTHILKLQQNFRNKSQVIELKVRAQISRVATNRIVVVKEFDIVVPVFHPTPYSGVLATNAAMADLLQQVATFCVGNM